MPDAFRPVGPPEREKEKPAPLGRRLFWFAAISAASLLVVACAAYVLRAVLFIG